MNYAILIYISIAIAIVIVLSIILIIVHLFIKRNNYLKNNKGVNYYNANNLPPNIKMESIKIDNKSRQYLKINFNRDDVFDNSILLCFPGGAESMFTFLNYTNFQNIGSRVIIFEGQKSVNKCSFQNAFPQMFINIQNDAYFVDMVIKDLVKDNKLFLTGKSDGAGFAVLYANISQYKNHIKAIGICSAAHFGTGSIDNIGPYGHINKTSNNTIIPYNILLPPSNISTFHMHGTGDQVIPYNGENYMNKGAYNLATKTDFSFWPKIDPTMKNTYVPNIDNYFNKIIDRNGYNSPQKLSYSKNTYSFQSASNNILISVIGQNHCWSGHTDSGPDSNKAPNMNLDATYLLCLFFKLNIGDYIPTINTIPYGLKTYDGDKLHH
jgi:poly(3-hydroxybutyrate) depolymerase